MLEGSLGARRALAQRVISHREREDQVGQRDVKRCLQQRLDVGSRGIRPPQDLPGVNRNARVLGGIACSTQLIDAGSAGLRPRPPRLI